MIKRVLFLLLFFAQLNGWAQFVSAKIKVVGLTCSMCSKSVHSALSNLSFIDSIKVDLESTSFFVQFKKGEKVELIKIKEKIEGAGFSVGELFVNYNFTNQKITNGSFFEFEQSAYHFVDVKEQVLNGEVSLKIVDKGFVSKKDFSKQKKASAFKCNGDVKSNKCFKTEQKGIRIYHLTL
jgi:copper chaperone CopZ